MWTEWLTKLLPKPHSTCLIWVTLLCVHRCPFFKVNPTEHSLILCITLNSNQCFLSFKHMKCSSPGSLAFKPNWWVFVYIPSSNGFDSATIWVQQAVCSTNKTLQVHCLIISSDFLRGNRVPVFLPLYLYARQAPHTFLAPSTNTADRLTPPGTTWAQPRAHPFPPTVSCYTLIYLCLPQSLTQWTHKVSTLSEHSFWVTPFLSTPFCLTQVRAPGNNHTQSH